MKKSVIPVLAILLSICSCSEKETDYIEIPEDALAGEIYHITTSLHEGTGREITTATLVVAENRETVDSRLLSLPVKIFRSTNPNPEEPVFWFAGGPGASNVTYWPPDELLAQRDVVMIGYRGIDGSTVLECPEFLDGTSGYNMFSEEAISHMRENFCDCQNRWMDTGIDLSCYTMTDVIDDMESARHALNYEKINLLSVSYGTRLAQVFAYRYPNRVNRSIMVSVNPPGHFAWNPETIDRQIQHYSKLWANDSVYSQKSDDLAASIKRVMNHMPKRWLFFKIDPDKVRFATFMGLYHTSGAGSVFDTFIAADNGDASGLALVSIMTKLQLKKMYRGWGDLISKSYADFDPSVDYNEQMKLNSFILGSPGSQLFAVSRAWQANTKDSIYNKSRISDVETLLLSGNIDLSTPAENAKNELLPYLNNGKQYILSEYGHVGDIMNRKHEAFVKAICTYYASGEADMSAYQAQNVDFTPQMSYPQLAKIVIACAVGIILLITGIVFLIRYLVRRRKLKRRASSNLATNASLH
jgi:pimeloyl-ACP methyl ester carboxylesterase